MISMNLVFNGKVTTTYLLKEYKTELSPKITIDNKKRKIILNNSSEFKSGEKFIFLKELFNILYVRNNSRRGILEYQVLGWYKRPCSLMYALLRHDFNRFSVTKDRLLRYIVMGVNTIKDNFNKITYYKPLLLEVMYDLTDKDIEVYADVINLYFRNEHKDYSVKVYKGNKDRLGYMCIYKKNTFNAFWGT